jgi:hypothetical protein
MNELLTLELDAFEQSATDATLKSPLETALDAIAEELRGRIAKIAAVEERIAEHDALYKEEYFSLGQKLERELDSFVVSSLKAGLGEAKAVLREGRSLTIEDEFFFTALGVTIEREDRDTFVRLVGKWDSSKIVTHRERIFGNLPEAEWKETLRFLSRHLGRRDDFDVEKRQLRLSCWLFEKEYDGRYQISYRHHDWPVYIAKLLRVLEAIEEGRRSARDYRSHPVLHMVLCDRNARLHSQDAFRSFELDSCAVAKIRPYKDSGVRLTLRSSETLTAFLAEMEAVAGLR